MIFFGSCADEDMLYVSQAAVERQMSAAVPAELQEEYNGDPASFWDTFYKNVQGTLLLSCDIAITKSTYLTHSTATDGFFNDRAWLRTEFPELADAVKANAGPKRIVEIGCGPGNTLFPLFAASENTELQLHGYDFAQTAVDLVKVSFGA